MELEDEKRSSPKPANSGINEYWLRSLMEKQCSLHLCTYYRVVTEIQLSDEVVASFSNNFSNKSLKTGKNKLTQKGTNS